MAPIPSPNAPPLRPTKAGLRKLVEILRYTEPETERNLLASLSLAAPEIASALRRHVIVFADLAFADNRGLQRLLKAVSRNDLALALKGADPAVIEKIGTNLSRHALQTLKQDMESLGPRPAKDVYAAQDNMVKLMRMLLAQNELFLERPGERREPMVD